MRVYPSKKRLTLTRCRKCENKRIIEGIPFCKKGMVNIIDDLCEDFVKIEKVNYVQENFFETIDKQ